MCMPHATAKWVFCCCRLQCERCSARPKGSICSLGKWADIAFWLCTRPSWADHSCIQQLSTGWPCFSGCSSRFLQAGWMALLLSPPSLPSRLPRLASLRAWHTGSLTHIHRFSAGYKRMWLWPAVSREVRADLSSGCEHPKWNEMNRALGHLCAHIG